MKNSFLIITVISYLFVICDLQAQDSVPGFPSCTEQEYQGYNKKNGNNPVSGSDLKKDRKSLDLCKLDLYKDAASCKLVNEKKQSQ